jgi:hypothetical protein
MRINADGGRMQKAVGRRPEAEENEGVKGNICTSSCP